MGPTRSSGRRRADGDGLSRSIRVAARGVQPAWATSAHECLREVSPDEPQSGYPSLPAGDFKSPALSAIVGAEELLEPVDPFSIDIPQLTRSGAIDRRYRHADEAIILNAPAFFPLCGFDYAKRPHGH